MKNIILIPARFASSRYPGKPLVQLRGAGDKSKTLIQRSFEAAKKVSNIAEVFVVTDDERIASACHDFGAPVLMTSVGCRNGTERCAEALEQLDAPDLIINFQGDALLTPAYFVEQLITRLESDSSAAVSTPVMRLNSDEVRELQAAEARGLVGGTSAVVDEFGTALYFSKRLIPHLPGSALASAVSPVRLHVGVYAYRTDALHQYVRAPETELERLEGLEQLRFLANRIPMAVVEVEPPPFALRELNNPEDVEVIEAALAASGIE
jgi:3-deoxy-manno-octulosonate cytidylyltransferase (CMP-KDO synthetase)